MKSILLAILFLFIPKLAIAQLSDNDKLIYLDSTQTEVYNENYKYYRVIKDSKLKKEIYTVYDYYKSGAVKTKGTSSSGEKLIKEGQFVSYYENGNKKSITNYTKENPNGIAFKWHDNGNKKENGEYILEDKNTKSKSRYKVNQFWDNNGEQKVTDGNGDYEEVGENTFSSGKIKDGYKDGIWKGHDKKFNYTFTETYENQKLVSGVSLDKENISHNYSESEIKPEYNKGINNFYSYIAKNFKMPNLPKGFEGKVIVSFVVDKDGTIIEPKILKSFGYGVDEEAIRVVLNSKKWTPATIRGIKVRCSYALPISIKSSN